MTKITIIIPARWDSSRFPGKPLEKIGAWPMLQWVFEQAYYRHGGFNDLRVIIATDSIAIKKVAEKWPHSPEVVMTSPECKSGTERCIEVVSRLDIPDNEFVVNLQGDEPFVMDGWLIQDIVRIFNVSSDFEVGTIYKKVSGDDPCLDDPNLVKVAVLGKKALYFSRANIPYVRSDKRARQKNIHIGLYIYTASFLKKLSQFLDVFKDEPAHTEDLEQLNFYKVCSNFYALSLETIAEQTGQHSILGNYPKGIDTPEDLEKANEYLKENFQIQERMFRRVNGFDIKAPKGESSLD